MRILIFWLFMFYLSTSAIAQGEGGVWYFGYNAGLNFCTGAPIPLTNGALSTNEGCAAISDPNCNILFYTDGITVWNANHQPMPNSTAWSPGGPLGGDPSSTQSGVIVPKPLSPNFYYIFTVDDNIGANGCRYSLVDMSLNGGLGDVVTTEKNILLFTPASEKITAVNHANGYDIWVIAHPWNTNMFFTYLVTSNGVNVVPVISNTGTPHSGNMAVTRGYSKASPSGDYVVLGIEGLDKYELFEFDNATGQLGLVISWPSAYPDAYGVEFSPDGTYLYGSRRWGNPLYQWDLTAGTPAQIIASQVQIGTLTTNYGGALQLAIDNKIYLARSGQQHLGVINFPNNPGATSMYIEVGAPLAGKSSREGLPTFITSYFNIADFTFQHQCFGDTTTFNISNVQQLDSAAWNFDDPGSGITNTSTSWQPYHIFSTSGVFEVELITYRGGQGDTVVLDVEIFPYPIPVLPSDTVICLGASIQLDAGNVGMDYYWSNGVTTQGTSFLPPDTITYTVTITNNGCAIVDSITAYPYALTSYFNHTTPLCPNDPITLNYTGNAVPGSAYNWDFSGATINSGNNQGPYNINWETEGYFDISLHVVQGSCFSDTTSFVIYNPEGIDLEFDGNDALCYGDATGEVFVSVSGAAPPYVFTWNSGANTQNLMGVQAGTYELTVTYNGQCEESGSYAISQPTSPVSATGIGDDIICYGDTNGVVSIAPSGGTPPYSYYWGVNGATTQSIGDLQAGYYSFTVEDAHGCVTVGGGLITEPPELIIYGSPDQFICPGETVEVSTFVEGGAPPYTIHWEHDGSVGVSAQVSPQTTTYFEAWVEDNNGCVLEGANSLVHVYEPVETVLFTNNAQVCAGDSVIIYANHIGGAGEPYTAYTSDGNPIVFPFTLYPESSMQIEVYAMDECEVPGVNASLAIEVAPAPTVLFEADQYFGCQPLEVAFKNLTHQDGNTYTWHFMGLGEDQFESEVNPSHIFQNAGSYHVQLKARNEFGCENSHYKEDMILVLPKPEANFLADPEAVSISKPVIFFENLSKDPIYQSFWSFEGEEFRLWNDTYVNHIYSDTGWFDVRLMVSNHHKAVDYLPLSADQFCYDTLQLSVHVFEDDIFMAPNAIHLNSSSPENRVFRPFIYGNDPVDYHMIIYNRWGERIFETFDYRRGWDGTMPNGDFVKSDNYVWMVSYRDKYGNPHQQSGNVLVLY